MTQIMTLKELCELLELNSEVIQKIIEIDASYDHNKISDIWKKLYFRDSWDEGIATLKTEFEEDVDGMKILTCLLNCALYTYEIYEKRNIPKHIFIDTMKFIPRFLETYKQAYGYYSFIWAHWFPRQLSLQEFRIGELEYEFICEGDECRISLHIPSDAQLKKEYLHTSYSEFKDFVNVFFPKFKDAKVYCNSWLLAPALQNFLSEDSNILYFQNCFDPLKVDEDSLGFMQWLFLKKELPIHELPEETSLQRAVKSHLIAGKKVGVAHGILKASKF